MVIASPRKSSKKKGPMMPQDANLAQTVTFLGWSVVCCVRWEFYSLQYMKFSLLTTPSKWKQALSLKMILLKLVKLPIISTAKICRFSESSSTDCVIWILYGWSPKSDFMITWILVRFVPGVRGAARVEVFHSPPSVPGRSFEASESVDTIYDGFFLLIHSPHICRSTV